MAKVFLDANIFLDAVQRSQEKGILDSLKGNIVYISTLTFHIYCYLCKLKMPSSEAIALLDKFQLAGFSEEILTRALQGPTADFEDNVQLHCAVEADCDLFLSSDQKLLSLGIFGKTKITSFVEQAS